MSWLAFAESPISKGAGRGCRIEGAETAQTTFGKGLLVRPPVIAWLRPFRGCPPRRSTYAASPPATGRFFGHGSKRRVDF